MKKLILTLLFLFICSPALATDFSADANCMGYWPMEADGGDETDLSGEDGTLVEANSVPRNADHKFGDYSRAYDGGDDFLAHADNLSTDIFGANQAISVVGFFKRTTDKGTWEPLVTKYYFTNGLRQYSLYLDTTDTPLFLVSPDGTDATKQATGATDLGTGSWVGLIGVYNDTDIRLYQDGSLDSNDANNPYAYTGGIFESNVTFCVGGWNSNITYNITCLVDDVAVFDRELTSVEASDIDTNGIEGAAAAGVIKTYNGLAWASVKTINGLAVGSIKTINSAAAQ